MPKEKTMHCANRSINCSVVFVLLFVFTGHLFAADRFKAYKPNTIQYRESSLNDIEEGRHIEYNFSTRYQILKEKSLEANLAYTGRFDFFWNSRLSSPVVNRLNNPEMHFRKYEPKKEKRGLHVVYSQLAYGHESNGQQISSLNDYLLDAREHKDDHISRGWDYVSAEIKLKHNWKATNESCKNSIYCTEYWITYKGILNDGYLQGPKEDEIFNNQRPAGGIRKYDGLQFLVSHEWQKKLGPLEHSEVSLKLTTGWEDMFKNTTTELQLKGEFRVSRWLVPLYATYRQGYLEEISDYSLKTSVWGLGFKFRQ